MICPPIRQLLRQDDFTPTKCTNNRSNRCKNKSSKRECRSAVSPHAQKLLHNDRSSE